MPLKNEKERFKYRKNEDCFCIALKHIFVFIRVKKARRFYTQYEKMI